MRRPSTMRGIVLWTLVVAHLAALWVYTVHERQSRYLALALEAREQWGDSHLDAAARLYREYATQYPTFSSPVVLVRNLPTRARAWYALGRIEAQQGHPDAALAAYAQSVRGEPGLGQRESRNLLLELGRYAALQRSADARLAADPDDLSAWWDRAAAHLLAGEPGEAADAYGAALGHVARWLDLHTRYGHGRGLSAEEADLQGLASVSSLLAGRTPDARSHCAQITTRQQKDEHYDRLCQAYLAAADGQAGRARELLAPYRPPGLEHEHLADALRARLGAP